MMRIFWKLAESASGLLEPGEGEVVLGDLVESGETGFQALRQVLGLVVRREVALWVHWRPWLTLVGLIGPLAAVLAIVSLSTANGSAVYWWLYANNWDWALIRNPGFWHLFGQTLLLVSLSYLTLVCWSWTAGFVLGSVSHGMVRRYRVLFCGMLCAGLIGAPRYFAYCDEYLHRRFGVPALPDSNSAVFNITFYREIFPLVVFLLLVVIPALSGIRRGEQTSKLRPPFRIAVWISATMTLAVMITQERGFLFLFSPHFIQSYLGPGSLLSQARWLLQFTVFWPAVYMATRAVDQGSATRTVST